MSSRSSSKSAATVLVRADEQTLDSTSARVDAPVDELPAVDLEPTLEEATIEIDVADEAPQTTESADDADQNIAEADHFSDGGAAHSSTDVLAEQLEQLVQSVSVVEDLSRRAREIASTDLARYDALLDSRHQYEAGRQQARAIRDQAIDVRERAFGQDARSAAEPLVANAERVLQAFTDLSTNLQERASAFVQQHPDIKLLLVERDAQAEQARQAEVLAARARRLQALIAACDEAVRQGVLREGRRLLDAIEAEFPEQTATGEQLRLSLQRRERADKDDAARQALAASAEQQARGDLEGAVNSLEQVDVLGLSLEISQDVFGRWSDACSRLAQPSGTTLLRFAPAQGRGLIMYADPAYPNGLIVFSSLGMGPNFPQGKVITDIAVLRRTRPFREAAPLPTTSWPGFGAASSGATALAPVRH